MKMFQIVLRSVEEVQDFVALASVQPFELTVGSERYSVNGKSFMQLFSLELSQAQQVRMECTEEEYWWFYNAAERFRV